MHLWFGRMYPAHVSCSAFPPPACPPRPRAAACCEAQLDCNLEYPKENLPAGRTGCRSPRAKEVCFSSGLKSSNTEMHLGTLSNPSADSSLLGQCRVSLIKQNSRLTGCSLPLGKKQLLSPDLPLHALLPKTCEACPRHSRALQGLLLYP